MWVVRELRDPVETQTRMPVRVEQRDIDPFVGIVLDVELDHVDTVGEGSQHRLEAAQHDLVVVHEGDTYPCGSPNVGLAHDCLYPNPRLPTPAAPRPALRREPGVGIEPTTC